MAGDKTKATESKRKRGPGAKGRSPSPLPPPKEVYRICMTVEHKGSRPDQVDTYLLEIPRDFVEALSKVDHTRLILHNHGPQEKPSGLFFPAQPLRLLASSDTFQDTPNVAIGTTIYHFLRTDEVGCTKACPPGCEPFFHPQINSLDISQEGAQWTRIPPPPHSASRSFPSLVVLRGRLYLIGGLEEAREIDREVTFGEVFDPKTQRWADLQPIPRQSNINVRHFVLTSLGDEEGKILMINAIKHYMDTPYYHKTGGKYNHVAYNLARGREGWENFKDAELSMGFHLSGCVASVEREKTIYWLDVNGLINSYNWELKELSSGPVVGFDHEFVLDDLGDQHDNFSLLHIWSDYFCLVWSWPSRDEPQRRTSLHTTFLRVVKDSIDPNLLFAHVVGCFVNWIDGNRSFRGGVIV